MCAYDPTRNGRVAPKKENFLDVFLKERWIALLVFFGVFSIGFIVIVFFHLGS